VGEEVQLTDFAAARLAADVPAEDPLAGPVAELMDLAMSYRKNANFAAMRQVLAGVVLAMGDNPDWFAVQQLALATYKSKDLEPIKALTDAQAILTPLDPEGANDPETLGLWGAVHKRLAERLERNAEQQKADLDTAILFQGRLLQRHQSCLPARYLGGQRTG
jgi:hypothetical protein